MEAGVRRVGSSTVLGRPYLQHAALTRRQFVPCNTFVTSGAILQRASVVLRQRAVPCVARAVAVRTPSRPSVAEERLPLPPTTADGYIPAVADAEDLLREHGACGVGLVASVHNERSREIVEKAIMALGCMEHRGGCAADDVSGDGAGVMTEIPWDLLRMDFPALREGSCGVGQVFFPDHDGAEAACRALFAEEAKKAGFDLLGWRCVPVDVAAIGPAARRTLPRIRQVALRWTGEDAAPEVLERELYVLRRVVESRVPGALDAMLAAEAVPAGASHPAALRARSAALAEQVYVCSLSGRSVVYKGMLASSALSRAFGDLQSPSFRSAWALYHRRFSTNTTPAWRLAQPMRVLGHNGEINTLQGNLNWVAAGEREMVASCASWAGDAGRLRAMLPLASPLASDSANLDRLAELMLRSGVEAPQALAALVPEAYRHNPALRELGPQAADFYSYYEGLQEGWDGPALLVFCDGRRLGARLDRNGLRPARYWRTARGLVHVASEVGVLGDVLDAAPDVLEKGRLGPGEMLAVDLEERRFWPARELVVDVAARQPYADWLRRCARPLLAARREAEERGAVDGVSEEAAPGSSGSSLLEGAAPASEGLARASTGAPILEAPVLSAAALWRAQTGAGYGLEDTSLVLESMATSGAEPIFCMGDDTPPAVLSGAAHVLSDYFKQRFAQVTNPPIDPLREGLVMSLEMRVGGRGNVLAPGPRAYRQVVLPSPVLFEGDVEVLARDEQLGTCTLDTRYRAEDPDSLRRAVLALCDAACDAVRSRGAACLLLRDRGDERSLGAEPWAERPAIPAALATGAVHHALIREGLRSRTSVVVDTAQCASTHQLAVLVGYGAHAVCPWLALESVRAWRAAPRTRSLIKAGKLPEVSARGAQRNLAHALEKGLLKIMSKMGISLLSCYHGAQVFEALGLGPDVVDLAFRGTPSRLGGLSMRELARESESFWFAARTGGSDGAAPAKLADFGFVQHRPRGEHHGNNQAMAKLLHKALGLGSRGADGTGGAHGGDADAFAAYRAHVDASPPVALRDLLEVRTRLAPLPLDRVEPVESIVRRFCTGGMSLGAISRETHETIALAMNRLGGKSNSGEGGEDPVRWEELADVGPDGRSARLPHLRGLRRGDTANSRIKQVASGRFGVTPHFLVNAEQLEIKIAQGAKPGEGGQLPGKKVSPYIAALRRSKPGVPLISPPPHHDIYSIEDLAQLVHDLHAVSPAALVSVKLVAQAGIGTVACGVAKAGADVIQVSGADGGTGASPVSSIKHAGGPVEMGLAETHAALVAAGLRDRVVLRADGGMRRGRDVIVAAALGADEVGFGTAAMLATGCIMARVCHTNNCPVGVASQREDLRARFPGVAADLVDFMLLVASEVRAELASLGLASLDELVGRPGALGLREGARASKTAHLDLSLLCSRGGPAGGSPDACSAAGSSSSQRIAAPARPLPRLLDDDVLDRDDVRAAIAGGAETLDLALDVRNTDRAAFARVGGAVARRWGDAGFEGRLRFDVRGAAGQSFAAFLVRGMEVRLVGEANDYVCKGMAGGLVTLNPPENAGFDPGQASIAGNTCLYGATGGSLFVHGRVGERFAVRNSAARAVVEGAGDHCCEYMTGGVVVCLGAAGRNAAAGMTGGVAYFYDPLARFGERVNGEIVAVQRVGTRAGEAQLKGLLEEHVGHTGSRAARAVLDDWEAQLPHFWQLVPPSEANTPECSRLAEEAQEEEARELERAAA